MNPTIELPITELKSALTGLGKVINRHTTLPVLGHLRVNRNQDGCVTLQATDLDTTAIYQAGQRTPGQACEFLVPFEPLNKRLKGFKGPVQLELSDNNRVRVTTFIGTSPMEQTLDTLPVKEFPVQPTVNGKSIPVDAGLRDCLRQAWQCCGHESSRLILHHACLDTRPGEGHYVAASDGRHLFCANSFTFDLTEPVLIPNRGFLHWNRFMEEGAGELSLSKKIKDEDRWVQLKAGPWTLITRTCTHEFPNWKQVVPAVNRRNTFIVLDASAMASLIAALPQLPGSQDCNHPVTLEVALGALVIKARAKGATEWTRLTVEGTTITGPATSVNLDREYVLKALRFGLNTLEIADDRSPVQFSEAGRRMVVMPLRPEADPVAASSTVAPSQPTTPPVTETTPPAQPQETQPMPKTTPTQSVETTPAETSPVKVVIQQIEQIKETLKTVLRECGGVVENLRQLEKDKRASDKEVQAVREKLRDIQSVRL